MIPLAAAALASPIQVVVGDWAARDVAETQPVKLAAFEGLAQTEKGAPVHVLGWYDGRQVEYGIEIPRLLSLLAFHDPNATVQGLDSVPADDRPPVNVVRFAFQTMVGIGSCLALLGVVYVGDVVPAPAGCRPAVALVLPGRGGRGPAVGRRADRRLDHDRGRPPALDRLRRDAHVGRRSPARAGSRSATRRSRSSTPGSRWRVGVAAAPPRARAARAAGAGRRRGAMSAG